MNFQNGNCLQAKTSFELIWIVLCVCGGEGANVFCIHWDFNQSICPIDETFRGFAFQEQKELGKLVHAKSSQVKPVYEFSFE